MIAAIAWIGASFYFVLLDQSLEAPTKVDDLRDGVGGELWEVHGGGFYHVKKYKVAPPGAAGAPRVVQVGGVHDVAVSGFALMVVLYYFNANAYLIDPAVADLTSWEAVGDQRRPAGRRPGSSTTSSAGSSSATRSCSGSCSSRSPPLAAWGCAQLFQPRAAFLQVGAMIGTVMAGNVFFNIIPAHWELINAKRAGRDPDPTPGIVAKQRSVHNNYFTLPVLFTMIAGHFAFTYGADRAWLVLLVLMFVGASRALFFNLRHQGRTMWVIPAAGVGRPRPAGRSRSAPTTGAVAPATSAVSFTTVAPVIEQRCTPCHAQAPTQAGFSSPPAGVVLETPEQIEAASRRHPARRLVEGDAARQPHRDDGRGARPRRRLDRPGRVDCSMNGGRTC